MAQQPAVVIIARHGPRLDGADQTWHLSTPTPYDPPLTYGGWNQSQHLGARIANILHAREKAAEDKFADEQHAALGVNAQDFGRENDATRKRADDSTHNGEIRNRSKRIKHRIVIHTSPFLRCVQTSVAIAAGIAQHQPGINEGGIASRPRTPASLHSASPKIKAQDQGLSTSYLAPISEPKPLPSLPVDYEPVQPKIKLRVDAFLGEWLNPQYFEQITPPPPSAMMVATAKAELLSRDRVDVYTPTVSNRSSLSTLWGGSVGKAAHESALDDMSAIQQALPTTNGGRRERASSVSSAASSDSDSSRNHWRPGHSTKPSWSSVLSTSGFTAYQPPKPQYAISSSDLIPRGYVSHARSACVDVDYNWDSSRAPQNWADGGVYGEEWSSMHKRFRKGLNRLAQWYASHGTDALPEDGTREHAPQRATHAQVNADDENVREELVIVLVTHGAGCNALMGALTGQPVLLDVGMASLTMAVRRNDSVNETSAAKGLANVDVGTDGRSRRPSVDLALSSRYEMKLVSSSEHLRSDSSRAHFGLSRSNLPAFVDNNWHREPPTRPGTSTAVGSIRRPSAANLFAPRLEAIGRSESAPGPDSIVKDESNPRPSPPVMHGLWTPPASGTPVMEAQVDQPALTSIGRSHGEPLGHQDPTRLPERRFPPSLQPAIYEQEKGENIDPRATVSHRAMALALNSHALTTFQIPSLVESPVDMDGNKRGSISDVPRPSDDLPQQLRRGLSQKGLWGARPAGVRVERRFGQEPKRRWTVTRNAA